MSDKVLVERELLVRISDMLSDCRSELYEHSVSPHCKLDPTVNSPSLLRLDAMREQLTASISSQPHPSAAQSAPDEREAFRAAHRELDLSEKPDAWGRPQFLHSHVEVTWRGFQTGAAWQRAQSAPAGAVPEGWPGPDEIHQTAFEEGQPADDGERDEQGRAGALSGAVPALQQMALGQETRAMVTREHLPGLLLVEELDGTVAISELIAQARAALESQQAASVGGEEIQVVGVRISSAGFGSYIADSAMGLGALYPGDTREPLMTVAQHERILRNKIAKARGEK